MLTILGFAGLMLRTRPSSWVNGAYAYAAAEDWLPGGLDGEDPAPAARELAAHWLRRFGPGTTTDLAWWMGWPLRTTRQALADCGAVEVELAVGPGWVAADDEPVGAAEPWVAVLPGLDRARWAGSSGTGTCPRRPSRPSTASATGTDPVGGRPRRRRWAQTRDGVIHALLRVGAGGTARQLDERIQEVKAMIGDTRFTVRFPGNIHARILGRAAGRSIRRSR